MESAFDMCLKYILMFNFYISVFQTRKVLGQNTCKVKENANNPLLELKKCLFKGYNGEAIPLQREEKRINIDVSFLLEDILFNDMSAEATLFLIMNMNWTDPLLRWNPKDYGNISQIILAQNEAAKVWSPSFTSAYTYRFGGRKNTDDLFRVSKLEINSEGHVIFSDLISMNSICEGDLTMFPFDQYECGSIIMSDNFENEVVFRVVNMGKYSNFTHLNMSLFTQKHLEVERGRVLIDVSKRVMDPGKEMVVTLVYLTVNMSRKTGTHILVFHLPAIGYSLLLLLTPWIAADSIARFIYPIVVLFGSIFQIDGISSLMKMPSSNYSQPIHLVSFYRDLMILSLVILVESIVSALLWKTKPLHESLHVVYERISTFPIMTQLTEHTLFEKATPEVHQGQKQEECPQSHGPALKCLAILLDRIIFCGLFFIQVVLYWKLVP